MCIFAHNNLNIFKMIEKKCFKCGLIKPITDFYKHPKTADGYLGKCKECAKNDVRISYEDNIKDIEYLEKERLRGRVKYDKYKYKNKVQHPENRSTAENLRKQGIDLTGKEIHHWNYNFKKDVFILNPRAHKLVHKYLTFDKETNMFRVKDTNTIIKSKSEHYNLIVSIFEENNVNYEIESYPNIID